MFEYIRNLSLILSVSLFLCVSVGSVWYAETIDSKSSLARKLSPVSGSVNSRGDGGFAFCSLAEEQVEVNSSQKYVTDREVGRQTSKIVVDRADQFMSGDRENETKSSSTVEMVAEASPESS